MAPQLSYGQFSQFLKRKGVKSTQVDKAWSQYRKTGDLTGTLNLVGGGDQFAEQTANQFVNPVNGGFALPVRPKTDMSAIAGYHLPGRDQPNVLTGPLSTGIFGTPGTAAPQQQGAGIFGRIPSAVIAGNSSSMPGEHSGSRTSENPDGQIFRSKVGPGRQFQEKQGQSSMDAALAQMLAQYDAAYADLMGNQPSQHDFTDQATALVNAIYAPQLAALSDSEGRARSDYSNYDKIVAGLYANLQSDLQGQLANTQQAYQAAAGQNTADTSALTGAIQNTYSQSGKDLAGVLQQLGIQSAAPDTLAPLSGESAYQQSQAQLGGQAQGNYLANTSQNMKDFQGGMISAAGAQGGASRQQLIRNLAAQLGNIGQQRADLNSQRAGSILSQSNTMSQNDLSAQQAAQQARLSALDILRQKYQTQTGADDTAYNRAFQERQYQDQQGASQQPEYSDLGQFSQKMQNTYGPAAAAYINVASQAAAGGGNSAIMQNPSAFMNEVAVKAQQALGSQYQPEAALEAAMFFLKGLNLPSTSIYQQ